jgi:hypothetical protein
MKTRKEFLLIALALLAFCITPAEGATMVITNSTLPKGTVGISYKAQLAATNGQPPYTWSLAPNSNSLPFGLSLNTNGLVSGTPTTWQTNNFIVQVVDANSSQTNKAFSITINPRPVIFPPGRTNGTLQITLTNACGAPVTIQFSTNMVNWINVLTTNLPCGIVTVTIPDTGGQSGFLQAAEYCPGFNVSPSSLSFSDPADGTTIPSQTLTIANIASDCVLSCVITSTVPWITLSSTQALIAASNSMVLTVGISDVTLYAGATYNGAIIITDTNTPANSQSLPVTLTIANAQITYTSVGGFLSASTECNGVDPIISTNFPSDSETLTAPDGCLDPSTGSASFTYQCNATSFSASGSGESSGPYLAPETGDSEVDISLTVGHLTQFQLVGTSSFSGMASATASSGSGALVPGKGYTYSGYVNAGAGVGQGQYQLNFQLLSGPGP